MAEDKKPDEALATSSSRPGGGKHRGDRSRDGVTAERAAPTGKRRKPTDDEQRDAGR